MKDTTKVRLDILVASYAEFQQQAEEAANRANQVKKALVEAMVEDQVKTHEVEDGGKIYRATFLQAVTAVVDENGLRQELGDEVVDEYCKKVLDKKALEDAMEAGKVDPFKVGKHVTERKNQPSVRFTVRAADDS